MLRDVANHCPRHQQCHLAHPRRCAVATVKRGVVVKSELTSEWLFGGTKNLEKTFFTTLLELFKGATRSADHTTNLVTPLPSDNRSGCSYCINASGQPHRCYCLSLGVASGSTVGADCPLSCSAAVSTPSATPLRIRGVTAHYRPAATERDSRHAPVGAPGVVQIPPAIC